MKTVLSICLLICCALVLTAANATAGAWLLTEIKNDMTSANGSMEPDGIIDSATYSTYDESGYPVTYEYDYDYDGDFEMISYHTYGEPAGTVKTETDADNDGDIDFTSISFLDDNCFHVMTETYDADGVLIEVQYITNDSNGNPIKVEDDDDADGDIDSVTYNTYDGQENRIKKEDDNDNDGDIDMVTTFIYNDQGDATHSESIMDEPFKVTTIIDTQFTYDGNGNKIKEDSVGHSVTEAGTGLPGLPGDVPGLDLDTHMITYYTWEYFENVDDSAGEYDCGDSGGGNGGGDGGGDGNQDGWETIRGTVTFNGAPVCAMALANGQYMFTCATGDDFGNYELNVPLDGNDQITLQVFVSGLAPFRQVTDASDLDVDVQMQATSPDSQAPTVSTQTATDASVPAGRARITGTVTFEGTPLCAMVLANGQYMFSCGGNSGIYDLTVPLDGNGQITLYVFVSGKQPYKRIFTP